MRLDRFIPGFAVLAAPLASAPAQQAALDWKALGDTAVQLLAQYVRVNTTNPPGNEMAAIRFLIPVLEREGFTVQVLDTESTALGASRGNLYVRLRGDGTRKAIALVHHMDVVPATPKYWSVDPFGGVAKDGYIYGRGALDMKGDGIVQLMAMIALERSGIHRTRDIVFIANSDEELGSHGARIFTSRHADLLKDVEYLLTEGGDNLVHDGKLEYFGVSVSEKRTFWQHLTVHGVASHGSRPTKANPVPRLVAALDKLARYETPLHVTPGVAKFFHDIAPTYAGHERAWLLDVRAALRDPRARAWFTSNTYWNAILRNTITETVLSGSNKTNVIPAEASAELDIRLLPDADPAAVLAQLEAVVNDTAVHWTPFAGGVNAPLENPIDTDLFRAIERASRERVPAAIVTTPMLTGATDRPYYRALGIVTYGFDPFQVESADAQRGVHGNDERVSADNVRAGVRYLYDVLRYAQ